MKKENKSLLFTGGHAGSTAYSVISALRKEPSFHGYKIFFIGSKSAVEGKKVLTFEKAFLPGLDVEYIELPAGRFQRKFTKWSIPSMLRVPLGFMKAFLILRRIKPQVTISFGGYVALPVVFASRLLRIPVLIHEQTSGCGLANRLCIPFADRILLSRNESLKYFPKRKSKVIGNPIWDHYREIKKKTGPSKPPVIFVTGGSRGSKAINDVAFASLPVLLSKYHVIHQTGQDDYHRAVGYRSNLGGISHKRYEPYSLLKPKDFSSKLDKADVVVARSSANTVSAVIAAGRLSVLIPLPFSQNDEQYENAKYAEKYRSAVIIRQQSFTKEILILELGRMIKYFAQLIDGFKKPNFDDVAASKKFVEEIKMAVGINES